MIELDICEESVQVAMKDSISYIDSFDLNDKSDTPVILGQTNRGMFVVNPDSLGLDISSLEKKSRGGGCFFCKTPEAEATDLKEYIAYDIDLQYVEDGFDFDGVRRGIKCICDSCYDELREEIATSPEIAVGLI